MEDYQQRVVDEKEELDQRLQKLVRFIVGAGFLSVPADEQQRLKRQREIMEKYSEVLAERIAEFQSV